MSVVSVASVAHFSEVRHVLITWLRKLKKEWNFGVLQRRIVHSKFCKNRSRG